MLTFFWHETYGEDSLGIGRTTDVGEVGKVWDEAAAALP